MKKSIMPLLFIAGCWGAQINFTVFGMRAAYEFEQDLMRQWEEYQRTHSGAAAASSSGPEIEAPLKLKKWVGTGSPQFWMIDLGNNQKKQAIVKKLVQAIPEMSFEDQNEYVTRWEKGLSNFLKSHDIDPNAGETHYATFFRFFNMLKERLPLNVTQRNDILNYNKSDSLNVGIKFANATMDLARYACAEGRIDTLKELFSKDILPVTSISSLGFIPLARTSLEFENLEHPKKQTALKKNLEATIDYLAEEEQKSKISPEKEAEQEIFGGGGFSKVAIAAGQAKSAPALQEMKQAGISQEQLKKWLTQWLELGDASDALRQEIIKQYGLDKIEVTPGKHLQYHKHINLRNSWEIFKRKLADWFQKNRVEFETLGVISAGEEVPMNVMVTLYVVKHPLIFGTDNPSNLRKELERKILEARKKTGQKLWWQQ